MSTTSERIQVGQAADFTPGKLHTVQVKNFQVVIIRREDGSLCGLRNKCSHLPLPISGGKLQAGTDNVVVCPWHNSAFDACSGENLDWVQGAMGITMPGWAQKALAFGSQPKGIDAYRVVEDDGAVFVELD